MTSIKFRVYRLMLMSSATYSPHRMPWLMKPWVPNGLAAHPRAVMAIARR